MSKDEIESVTLAHSESVKSTSNCNDGSNVQIWPTTGDSYRSLLAILNSQVRAAGCSSVISSDSCSTEPTVKNYWASFSVYLVLGAYKTSAATSMATSSLKMI